MNINRGDLCIRRYVELLHGTWDVLTIIQECGNGNKVRVKDLYEFPQKNNRPMVISTNNISEVVCDSASIHSASKYVSWILRHKPDLIGETLDEHGWVDIDKLIIGVQKKYKFFNRFVLDAIVLPNNKHQYQYDDSNTKIRASQGQSIPVDLGMELVVPPDTLYHGTSLRFMNNIRRFGIRSMNRNYVYLTTDIKSAIESGCSHGVPYLIEIDTRKMYADKYAFYMNAKGMYLTDYVPSKYFIKKK